jgi:pimeloyl-ACP methyl ester carboxylesterase
MELDARGKPMTIETFRQDLPHGITLSCRAAGQRGRPALVFLHGFPEAAFVWDELLEYFGARGYRAVAPNLRGFEQSSQPQEVEQYRAKHIMMDIAALIAAEGSPLECLIAHDWGGAIAWNIANQRPELTKRLMIVNSPHPGTFLRELQRSPKQQAASAYMNFLIRDDAAKILAEDDYRRLFGFFRQHGGDKWLTDAVKQQYRDVWDASLQGGLNYYRASPLRPPREGDAAAAAVTLPREMLTVGIPTFVLWAMLDDALCPELVDGLDEYIPKLALERVPDATHWIVHERPQFVAERLANFLASTQ